MRHVSVPKPRLLKSGNYYIWLDKEHVGVTARTSRECEERALSVRISHEKTPSRMDSSSKLDEVVRYYINSRENVLSPSTIRGYNTILRTRFKAYMEAPVDRIDYQRMISDESRLVSAKTVTNSWFLIKSSLKYSKFDVPDVRLPQQQVVETAWLDYDQILLFIDAIKGYSCEVAALLGLHGLRRSEIVSITPNKVKDGFIHVYGAIVRSDYGLVEKKTNKNISSTRVVPIMIPRLQELIDNADCESDKPYVTMNPNHLYTRINEACDRAGLPHVGVHGLRRSFASLCYHLGIPELQTMRLGGWSDYDTMRKIYTKLADKDVNEGIERIKDFFKDTK